MHLTSGVKSSIFGRTPTPTPGLWVIQDGHSYVLARLLLVGLINRLPRLDFVVFTVGSRG